MNFLKSIDLLKSPFSDWLRPFLTFWCRLLDSEGLEIISEIWALCFLSPAFVVLDYYIIPVFMKRRYVVRAPVAVDVAGKKKKKKHVTQETDILRRKSSKTIPSSFFFPWNFSLLAPEFSSLIFFLDFWLTNLEFTGWSRFHRKFHIGAFMSVCRSVTIFFRGYVILLIRFVVQFVSTSFDRYSVLILYLLLGTMFCLLCISRIMILSISCTKMITMM